MKQLLKINNEAYIYITNLESFASSITEDNNEVNSIKEIIIDAKTINDLLQKAIKELNKDAQNKQVQIASELAEKILYQLKRLKCKDEFIFEKADLIVGIFLIKEKLTKIKLS